MAIKVLFDLDQNFRTWPQLSIAYDMKSVFPDATHGHWTGGTVIGRLCGVFCSTGHERSRASIPSYLRWWLSKPAGQSRVHRSQEFES